MPPERSALSSIHRALLRLWAEHPHMADTAEGIAAFWLYGEDVERVQRALERLVEEGLVQRRGDGPDAVYLAGDAARLRREARREADGSRDSARE
ncbi:hypothetical protein HS125_15760 [bacterium]|nr:hypothetical protein [bacterium]